MEHASAVATSLRVPSLTRRHLPTAARPLLLQWRHWAAEFKRHGIPVRACHALWLTLVGL